MGKFKLKKGYYSEPTAIWFKIIGDFLNLVGAGASVSAIIQNEKNLAILFIIVGALGKSITNAFTEMQTTDEKNEG
jgi:hypothetical protein